MASETQLPLLLGKCRNGASSGAEVFLADVVEIACTRLHVPEIGKGKGKESFLHRAQNGRITPGISPQYGASIELSSVPQFGKETETWDVTNAQSDSSAEYTVQRPCCMVSTGWGGPPLLHAQTARADY